MSNKFPKNFIWGAATSSYQIEGASNIDGKGKSIWDTFSHTKGKVFKNQNADIATDHYNRHKEDVALMNNIKLKAYRFSISWPRIFPNGKGKVNKKGLDFYSKLIDELLKKNIKPFITLYHWDLPQKIQNSGGWSNREITKYFTDYSYLIAKKFGDRCKNFITLNEPAVFSTFGYLDGYMAPGLKNKKKYLSCMHNINLAHGFAFKSIKSVSSNIKVGCTLNMAPCLAFSNSNKDIKAKITYDTFWNRAYADPMYLGSYPKIIEDKIQNLIKENDMKIIYQKNDFIGLNHYQHIRVISDKKNLLGARSVNLKELSKITTRYTNRIDEIVRMKGANNKLIKVPDSYSKKLGLFAHKFYKTSGMGGDLTSGVEFGYRRYHKLPPNDEFSGSVILKRDSMDIKKKDINLVMKNLKSVAKQNGINLYIMKYVPDRNEPFIEFKMRES